MILVTRRGEPGIDLDNEDPGPPAPIFPKVIRALRRCFGREALITLPVYEGQIALYKQYASLVGGDKVAIGVSNPGCGTTDAHRCGGAPRQVRPAGGKFGMMFWNVNSPGAGGAGV